MSIKKKIVRISFIFLAFAGITSCTAPEVEDRGENTNYEKQQFFTGKDELEER